jgi:GT2 family glycosyltransferase
MNQIEVSIIVVNFNSEKWLPNFLGSIGIQSANFELIFVDNNSENKIWKKLLLHTNFPIKIVELDANVGFGTACNIGVKLSSGNLLAFLNTDTYFDKNFISQIYADHMSSTWDIASPKILNYEGIDLFKGKYLSIDFFGYVGLSNTPFYAEGSGLFISKKYFESLGQFDEDYFMYSEDIDLCWRGHLLGMKLKRLDYIELRHFGGGSSTKSIIGKNERYTMPIWRRYEVEKNNISNILKCYSVHTLIYIIPSYLLLSIIESLFYLFLLEPKVAFQIIKAWSWNIVNLKKTINKRKKIQKTRIMSDFQIARLMSGVIPNKIFALLRAGIPKFK